MNILTLDFETYYDQQYSLSKLSTEEYIRSELFEAIGVSVQVDDGTPEWFTGTMPEIKEWLQQYQWQNGMLVAHNALFDAAILSWRFDIHPKVVADTLSMARAKHGVEVGGSLAKLAEFYQIGVKGTEVVNALGKRRLDFSPADLARYGEYCCNDTKLTYELFTILMETFPKTEMRLIDQTIKMFSEPVLELDAFLLEQHLSDIKARKEELLARVAGSAEDAKKNIMSNPKFAQLLQGFGVEPPMKVSPTTSKPTYAFAKSDEGMKELLEHSNPDVQTLAAVRLGVKSTLEETRTERFLSIAQRGKLPIPLKYYAAHTSRWGGMDKINLQNLPSRGADAGKLKHAIKPPEGYVIIDSDSSQIEARTLAWMAGQNDLVEAFRKGEDVYKIMASAIYRKPVEEINKSERFVGKSTVLGCIAEGTLVLSDSGWKPIEQISLEDKLWDGEEWVCHQGLVSKGYKKTVSVCGSWLTPDHKILCGGQWKETQYVVADANTLSLALDTGAANLPLRGISEGYERESRQSLLSAIAAPRNTQSISITSRTLKALDAMYALKRLAHALVNCIGGIAMSLKTTFTGNGYSIEYPVASAGATLLAPSPTPITAGVVSQYTSRGAQIAEHFYATSSAYPIGMTPNVILTASITTRGTNPTTYGLLPEAKTHKTNEKSEFYSRNLMTYDIAYAGPRNRFTIATGAGALIVHNCGYGMGAKKFKLFMQMAGVEMSPDEAAHIINTYRTTYPTIPNLWGQGDKCLRALVDNQSAPYGKDGVIQINGFSGVLTPNGIPLRYHELRRARKSNGEEEIVYTSRTGITGIWGGKFTENLIQHLARCIIGEQLLRIAKRYRVVLTVHDAIACIAPKEEAFTAQAYVEECMRWTPAWAEGLPLNCESGIGETYGEC